MHRISTSASLALISVALPLACGDAFTLARPEAGPGGGGAAASSASAGGGGAATTTGATSTATSAAATVTTGGGECAPGMTAPCYDGPFGTEGVGDCAAGSRECGGDGMFGPCKDAVHPVAEACGDGSDEDCNGATCPGAVWSFRLGGSGSEQLRGLALDALGRAFVTGSFEGSVDFGDGAPLDAGTKADIFFARYGSDGQHAFSKAFGAALLASTGEAITILPDQSVMIAATCGGPVSMGGGASPAETGDDACVARYDGEGAHQMSASFGDTFAQRASGVAASGGDDAVLTGVFSGSIAFGPQTLIRLAPSVFVASLAQANPWAFALDVGSARAPSVAATGGGEVVLAGSYTAAFDPGTGQVLPNAGGSDVFLARYDATGAAAWALGFGDGGSQVARAVALDAQGNALVGGDHAGTITLGGAALTSLGGTDAFVAKVGPAGAVQWGRSFGGPGDEELDALAVGADGAVLMAGAFAESIDVGGVTLTSAGGLDCFVAKASAEGEMLWAQSFGGPGDQRCTQIAVDAGGGAVVGGVFDGTIDLGQGALACAGGLDVFVARLAP